MKALMMWAVALLVLALGLVVLLPGEQVGATPTSLDGYQLTWWTVDGGGVTFAVGSDYSLGGTLGQPDPGLLAGGGYSLGGGFWRGGVPHTSAYGIYLPILQKN